MTAVWLTVAVVAVLVFWFAAGLVVAAVMGACARSTETEPDDDEIGLRRLESFANHPANHERGMS